MASMAYGIAIAVHIECQQSSDIILNSYSENDVISFV